MRVYPSLKTIAVALAIALTSLPSVMAQNGAQVLKEKLLSIISDKNMQVGIAVIIDGKDTLVINDDRRYPMMSVFKFHQALAVVDYMERHDLPLSTHIYVDAADLKPDTYSPLRDRYPSGGEFTVAELLTYTLQLSDNNACDILFGYTGGVGATDAFVRALEYRNFAITATEADMHRDMRLCYDNWTFPSDSATLLEALVCGRILSDAGRQFIVETMIGCDTGKNRLLAPLQSEPIVVGHKTGTGDRNDHGRIIGCNDIGFVMLPNGHRYTIAVFVKDSAESESDTSRIIADISAAVYDYVKTL